MSPQLNSCHHPKHSYFNSCHLNCPPPSLPPLTVTRRLHTRGVQAIASVRTVHSFANESYETRQYDGALRLWYDLCNRQAVATGRATSPRHHYAVVVWGANGDLDLLGSIDGRSYKLQCKSASEIREAVNVWAGVYSHPPDLSNKSKFLPPPNLSNKSRG